MHSQTKNASSSIPYIAGTNVGIYAGQLQFQRQIEDLPKKMDEAMNDPNRGGLEPAPKGKLRIWKEIYSYKGDNPAQQGDRMVSGELKKNGDRVHLEYNPEKVRSGKKEIGKDYVVKYGDPGRYPSDYKGKFEWIADRRANGDTLEQIAGADSHGVEVDKVNRDGSLKEEG